MNKAPKKQQGVALITALAITALAVSIAASLAYQQYTASRLSSNLHHLQQAYLYASGMENWVKVLLRQDFNNTISDDLTEDWATEIPAIPIPGGYMKGRLTDLQARLNINNIIPASSKNNKMNRPHIAKLMRLFQQLQLSESPAQSLELIDNLIDWIDSDSRTRDRGAESNYYRHLESGYLPSNTALVSTSEIQLIKGFDRLIPKKHEDSTDERSNTPPAKESIFEALSPYISTLPVNTKINVNTASKEVLLSLEALNETDVNNIITDREEKGFITIGDFLQTFPLEVQQKIDRESISVTTNYFLLTSKIEIGHITLYINSIINRDKNGNSHVIRREFSQI